MTHLTRAICCIWVGLVVQEHLSALICADVDCQVERRATLMETRVKQQRLKLLNLI